MDYFVEQSLNGLSLGAMYAFIALGYTMVYGVLKIINFAHGEFFMVGGLVGYLSLNYLPIDQIPLPAPMAIAVTLIATMLLAALASASLAVICERLVYKPLRGDGRIAALLAAVYGLVYLTFAWKPFSLFSVVGSAVGLFCGVTAILWFLPRYTDHLSHRNVQGTRIAALLAAIGLSLALQNATIWVFSASPRAWPEARTFLRWEELDELTEAPANLYYLDDGKKQFVYYEGQEVDFDRFAELKEVGHGLYMDAPLSRNWQLGLVFLTLFGSGIALYFLVMHTKLGKAMRALSYNADTARLMGINPDRVITFTFFVGAMLAGIGGVLWGMRYGKIEPYMGFLPGLKAFVAAVLGGIGSIPGAIVGGLLLGYVETLAAAYGLSNYRDAVAFVVLITILLVRPQGLLGSSEGQKL